MFNHLWTLFANQSYHGDETDTPGGVAIDPNFLAKTPDPASNVRRIIFGKTPDHDMVTYRCRQFLACVHASKLKHYITIKDKRIAYDLQDSTIADPTYSLPKITNLQGSNRLWLIGEPNTPDDSGVIRHEFHANFSPPNLTIENLATPNPTIETILVTFPNQASAPIPLATTGYSLVISEPITSQWRIELRLRPKMDVAQIVAIIDNTLGESFASLFPTQQPFRELLTVWRESDNTIDRAAALAIAIALLTEYRQEN